VTGLFHTATPFSVAPTLANKYVLKAVTSSEESVYATGSTVVLDMQEVAHLQVRSVRLETSKPGGSANDVRTDVEISAAAAAASGTAGPRQLVQASAAWTATGSSTTNSRADMLLEDGGGGANRNKTAPLKGSIDGWDQFKANEELFNVKGSYDENLYTTALDKTQMTFKKIKEAERIAREIETSVSTNMHVAEERGHAIEGDYDEEDLYSGVLKKDQGSTSASKSQKVMNYAAAAAAKADTVPPGFNKSVPDAEVTAKPNKGDASEKALEEKTTDTTTAAEDETKATTAEAAKVEEATAAVAAATATAPEETKKVDASKSKLEAAPKSKLSATAKSFSLNVKAKAWAPTFGAAAAEPPPPMAVDQGPPMPQSQPQPPYMSQPTMGQPGTCREKGRNFLWYDRCGLVVGNSYLLFALSCQE
jgi:hypothetical protein